jgi:hypothetical protein
MYGRMTRLQTSPDAVDKGIAFFKENVAPKALAAPGNAGAILLVDRKTGTAIGITMWETTQALNANEQLGITSRTGSVAAVGGTVIDVDRYEQVLVDRAQPPKTGTSVRLNIIAGVPDKLDNMVKFMQTQVLPVLKAQKGYRSTIVNVNRVTGRSSVSTVWDSIADLEASESKVSALRRSAAEAAGAPDVKVEILETAFSEIKQPTKV